MSNIMYKTALMSLSFAMSAYIAVVRRSGLILTVFESVEHGFDPDLWHEIFTFYLVDSCVCIYDIYYFIHLLLNELCFKNSCDALSIF